MTKKRDTNSRPQPQASSKLPPFSFQISPCFLLHIPRVTNWSFLNKVLEFCKGPKKASKWVSRFCAPKQCKQPLAFFLGGCMVECYKFTPLLQKPTTFFPFILYNSTRRTTHFAKNYRRIKSRERDHGDMVNGNDTAPCSLLPRCWNHCIYEEKMRSEHSLSCLRKEPLRQTSWAERNFLAAAVLLLALVSLVVCQNRATPH